jgi:cbb3-type cytochrome oxidase maturation protein
MKILLLLISISLVVALLFLTFFLWSFRSGQFDDVDSPSMRMLFEDKKTQPITPDKSHTTR